MTRQNPKRMLLAAVCAVALGVAPAYAATDANGGFATGNGLNSGANNGAAIHSTQSTIAQVQRKLRAQGYYSQGTIDGEWGPATRQALQQFQKAHQLTQNGQLDSQTLSALGLGSGGSQQSASNSGSNNGSNDSSSSNSGSGGSSGQNASNSSSSGSNSGGSGQSGQSNGSGSQASSSGSGNSGSGQSGPGQSGLNRAGFAGGSKP